MSTKLLRKIISTCIITITYGTIWIILELIIEKSATFSTVDNIMLLLFIPVAWMVTEYKEEKNNGKNIK